MDNRLSNHRTIRDLVDQELRRSARLFVLVFLHKGRGALNIELLHTLLVHTGHKISRDELRAVCRSLEGKDYVKPKPFDEVEVWALTQGGLDVARGLTKDPDIADFPYITAESFSDG